MKCRLLHCIWPFLIILNLLAFAPKPTMAAVFGFGGEEALLAQLLSETIALVETNAEQLNQLQQMFTNTQANLELMYKVHDGLDRAINQYKTFADFTDFSEFKNIHDIASARMFIQDKYGYIQDVQRDTSQKHTTEVLAQETTSQAEADRYSRQLNNEGNRFNADIDRADSIPKIQKVSAKATVANMQASSAILRAHNKTNRLLTEDLGKKNRESERERLKAINTEKQFVAALSSYHSQRGQTPLY